MTMEPAGGQRNVAKEQYANVRKSLEAFEDRVVARYWDEDAPVRTSFARLLGSLDRLAGWLLDDREISRRGQVLMGQTVMSVAPEQEAEAAVPEAPVPEAAVPEAAVPEDATAGARDESAADAVEPAPAQDEVAGEGLVDVTFTFRAGGEVGRVVLCGEFNEWSVDGIQLDRGDDDVWQAVVALEPGRSYRYRYLIDGERWENATDGDQEVPNPYGSFDSVRTVEPAAGPGD
jgi:hypothetical protein